jgi:hypothetical protein
MAMYHLRVKFVQRSKGRSSVAAAAYRSGSKLVDERTGKTHDYSRKGDIEHSEIMVPETLPEAVAHPLCDRGVLWNGIETRLTHPRAQPAFEVEAALPRELSREQCVQLVREFARDLFVGRGLVVDANIHRSAASDGADHPHVHLLITTRRFEPDGTLGKAARDMQDSPKLVEKVYALEEAGKIDEAVQLQNELNLGQWRQAWEDYSNRFLDDAGSSARIDHRTLEAQRIDREAQPNIGFAFHDRLRALTGHLAQRVEEWRAVGWRNAMRQQLDAVRWETPDLAAEFIAHARAYARRLFPELQPDERAQGRGMTHER